MRNAKNEVAQQQTQQNIINELQLKLVNQVADNEEKKAEIKRLTENSPKQNDTTEQENTSGKWISTLDELQCYFAMIDGNAPLTFRPEFVKLAPVAEYHLAVVKQLDEQKKSNEQ